MNIMNMRPILQSIIRTSIKLHHSQARNTHSHSCRLVRIYPITGGLPRWRHGMIVSLLQNDNSSPIVAIIWRVNGDLGLAWAVHKGAVDNSSILHMQVR